MLKKIWIRLFFFLLYLVRLNAGSFLPDFVPLPNVGGDGNIDSSALIGTVNLGSSAVITGIAIDNNNKIVAGGFINAGFNTNFILARFNNDGSLDRTFNAAGPQPGLIVTNAYVNDVPNGVNIGPLSNGNQGINNIVIDNSNKIVAVGYVNDGTSNFFTVARYNPNGTLDLTFNSEGLGTNVPGVLITDIEGGNATATAAIIDSNNKIVVTGYSQITSGQTGANRTDIALVRYNNDGSLDTTLNPSGITSGRPGVVVTNITGSTQTTITGNNNWAYAITIDNDNKILVGGAANITVTADNSTISESTGSLVIRYNPDGSLDTTFNTFGIQHGPPGTAITVVNNTDKVTSLKIDNNNKIVLMGSSTFPTNNDGQGSDLFVIRYNEDASFDPSLNTGALLPPFIEGIVITDIAGHPLVGNSGFIDNNNNIVLGGWTSNQLSNTEIDPTNVGEYDFLVVRYLPSGALDTSFNNLVTPGFVVTTIANNSTTVGFLPNARGNSIALDNNNNIVLAGFSSDGPEKDFTIARYTNDGILDVTNFNPTGFISNQPGVAIVEAQGGTNPYNTKGVAFTVAGMTDVINLPNIAIKTERAAQISSFFVGFKRPFIDAPVDIFKENDAELMLRGTAHPHADVHLSLNGMLAFSFKASSEGSWMVKFPPLVDGDYHVYATSIDPESHLALSSNSINVKVRTKNFITPTIILPRAEEHVNSEMVNIEGTGQPDTPIMLFLNGKFVAQATVDSSGVWRSVFNDLADGNYVFHVVGFDETGRPTRQSPFTTFYVDNIPVIPRIDKPRNDQKIRRTYVYVSGTAKPLAKLSILVNEQDKGTVLVDKKGNWRIKLTDLEPQDYKIQVVSHGVKKLHSEIINVNVIKRKPYTPRSLSAGTKKGSSARTSRMSIKGKLEPKTTIKLLMNGQHLADILSNEYGNWRHQVALSSVPEGVQKIQYAVLNDEHKPLVLVEKSVVIHKQSW